MLPRYALGSTGVQASSALHRNCSVVGNDSSMRRSKFGPRIDAADAVYRMNFAPVSFIVAQHFMHNILRVTNMFCINVLVICNCFVFIYVIAPVSLDPDNGGHSNFSLDHLYHFQCFDIRHLWSRTTLKRGHDDVCIREDTNKSLIKCL